MSVLTLKNVTYKYEGAKKTVLKGLSAEFEAGKVYTIVGRSGSGKSTMLSLISGLDVCTDGEILHGQNDLKTLDRDKYRAKDIGVVFQSFNLLTNATAVENIVLSMNISGSTEKDKETFAYELLEKVGIDRDTADRKILQLSGGEQQRVGIARALSHNPDIIIADEPTGNLDKDTEIEILKIFTSLAHKTNKCVIIVTHSKKVTSVADVVLGISEGKLIQVKSNIERQGN
ncbi:ABC transporter ATP-binding protein [Clostridium sp. MSJ-11]|uniref:ABC transporter ATP-binding protein n=1 Tax=Clostridium mobile TaxID=2841512 RepID=A0ABS6EDJ1_9CLOT|nr:ABC transporter ATP-binding protein [Clostridium mobile]MBU5483271.1 ABC transporter ATP-binding protein [Clostridium mobile]